MIDRVVCILVLVVPAVPAQARLLLTDSRLEAIRLAAGVPGSPHAAMRALLDEKLRQPLPDGHYDRAYFATLAAFQARLTRQPSWCALSYAALESMVTSPAADAYLPDQGYGLARATVGAGFAFAYDWCRQDWNERQQSWVRERLMAAAEAWRVFRHANVEAAHKGSNWVAVCRAGELFVLAALRDEQQRADRYRRIKDDLRRHLEQADELGVTQEGIGYTGYGGIFLLRALLVLRSLGDRELDAETARHQWWRQAMYAGTFAHRRGQRLWLMSGVSGEGIGDEGWASLLFAFTPPEHLAHYRWWYDRHLGPLSGGPPGQRFDPRREGILWALLYYPETVAPVDPGLTFPPAVTGTAGLTLFRNRWQDENDILLSVHGDTRWHSHAWDQPEALQIQLFAYGARFAAGPEKSREPGRFSSILLNGRHVLESARGTVGAIREPLETNGDQSRVVLDGGTQYRSLSGSVQRRVEVRFGPKNRATVVIADSWNAPADAMWTWQIVPGRAANGEERVQASHTGKAFELRSKGGRIRGSVASRHPVEIATGEVVAIRAPGRSRGLRVRLELRPSP